ncbi:MAG TPA: hypothetical protein PKE55_04380 [Kiritimatiellia bacterium]|nr:hypothetical protein [Kiritimatiellia bacterium]
MNSRPSPWLPALIVVPIALLAGIILGGLAPRRELEKARIEIQDLKTRGERRGGASSLNILTDVVRIPSETTPRNMPESRPAEPSPFDSGSFPETDDSPAPELTESEEALPPSPSVSESLADRLDDAREAWAIRAEIARNSFLSRTRLRNDEAVQFDVVIAAMNLRLQSAFQNLSQTLLAGEDLTTERGVRVLHDLTGVLTLTYDELDRKLPSTWRAAAGDDFDLTDFIDPSVAEPLIPVEHKLEDRPRRRGRP